MSGCCRRALLRSPENLLLLALSLRQSQWLLQRDDGGTALVLGSRLAPDTDAFRRGVSRSLDVSERHVSLLTGLPRAQTDTLRGEIP